MPGPFERDLVDVMPPWLRRTRGGKLLHALGIVLDALADRTADAMAARLPSADLPDALPYIGRDRRIVRGLNEPAEVYAPRLRRWWTDHKTRGGPIAMLRQLEAYYATAPRQIDLVYETGTRYTLTLDLDPTDPTGKRHVITKDGIEWREGNDQLQWAQAWIFVRYTSTPYVSYDEAQSVIAIVRDWAPAHVTRMRIFGIFPGGDLWGYPEGELWGDDDDLYWGAPTAIDFYGVEPDFLLTIEVGGDEYFVTVDDYYVAVT
jgi:hypothetical protein